MFKLDISVNV